MTINMSELVRGGTFCLSKAGLAVDTDENDLKIAAPNGAGVDYVINGILYHKADTTGIDTNTASIQAASTSCLYLVCLDSSGTLSIVKGDEVATADITSGKEVLTWPTPTEDTCCIGAIRIDTATDVTFTMGTDDYDKTGVTDTW